MSGPALWAAQARDPRVRAIWLARNFGQTAAMACGMGEYLPNDHGRGSEATLGMRGVAVQPLAGCLEERGRTLHLAFGVVRFDFLLERVVADLPLVERFDEVLMEPRIQEAGFGEVFTEGGQQYDVYDSAGSLVGTVNGLPATSGIEPSVAAGRIALVVPDSLGEQVVHVFRIRTALR